MRILVYKDREVFDAVTAATPTIGDCRIDVPAPERGDGALVHCHDFDETAAADFEAAWPEMFADKRLSWGASDETEVENVEDPPG
jgi:hypothetical protein